MKRIAIIVLHVSYWMIYLILLFLFLFMTWLQSRKITHLDFRHAMIQLPIWIMLLLPPIITYYTAYGILFARFLRTKRLLLLATAGCGTAVLATLLGRIIPAVVYAPRYHLRFTADIGMELLVLLVIAVIHGVMALVIKGFISWYEEIHLKELLTRKNYEMELALIKSQLSPHFLFNTLNNIDVLILKDPQRASGYLNQLSGILRFMLYETKTEQIHVREELQYIDKYIELQKIRVAHPEYINYTVEGQAGNRLVEPLLFIPFIENAFKHAEKKVENAITIRFTFEEDRIVFVCQNKHNKAGTNMLPAGAEEGGGGLGNSLIRRRLSLLYPGRHQLDIESGDHSYKATLTLTYAN